jgi:hypothetical protein
MTNEEQRELRKKKFRENMGLTLDASWRKEFANRPADPNQAELDKIEARIKDAKALTEQDMREIERALAHQDIQKQIFRSQMMMRSDEAREKQRQPRPEPEKELSAKEKFMAKFKKKDRDYER